MAVTKILPIRSTIQKSVDYICDPDKTEGSLLIHSEHCVPQMAGQIFHHHLNQCRAGGNTVGRHLVQSFAIGEVDPAVAHEIGKKLAEQILGGRYAYVFATHVDKSHVHNHFVWGAADIVSHKRYRSNKATYHEIRNISDQLCKEYELSVIVPQGVGKSYSEWQADKSGTSWKTKLKTAIDNTVSSSASFEDFIKQMEEQGYTIKRGKHIAFKAPNQERFTRAKRLGTDYTEEEIISRIAKSLPPQSEKEQEPLPTEQKPQNPIPPLPIMPPPQQKKSSELKSQKSKPQPQVPPQQKPKTPKPPPPLEGIALWESIIARHDTAEIYNLMQENGGYQHFVDLMAESRIQLETIDNGIEANKKRIASWRYLRKDIANLNRTLKVYNEYQELKKSTKLFAKRTADKFYNANESDMLTHQTVLRELKDYKRPLPTIKEIDAEIAKGKNANATNQKAYTIAKKELDRFHAVHSKLFSINREHAAPQRQKQRSNSHERD